MTSRYSGFVSSSGRGLVSENGTRFSVENRMRASVCISVKSEVFNLGGRGITNMWIVPSMVFGAHSKYTSSTQSTFLRTRDSRDRKEDMIATSTDSPTLRVR